LIIRHDREQTKWKNVYIKIMEWKGKAVQFLAIHQAGVRFLGLTGESENTSLHT